MAARCTREQVCKRIGSGQVYATASDCIESVRVTAARDLSSCPMGVDDWALERCVATIQGEDCANAVDSILTLDGCRVSALCIH